MKLPSLPSSFPPVNSRGDASGCIAGILHWILCRSLKDKNLAEEEEQEEDLSKEVAMPVSSAPGILARLMGLESMPALPCPQLEPIFRKSKSFTEIPTYLRKESEEFLVLSFGDAKGNRGERKMAGRKLVRFRNKPNEISADCRKKLSFSEGEIEMEWGSQNSSPVSVLDLLLLPLDADGEFLTSPVEKKSSISECMISVKKLEKEEISQEVEENFSFNWEHICKLGEEDLNSSEWITAKKIRSQEAEEIGCAAEMYLLELLLSEVVFDMFE